jgi:hypothetical protein
MGWKYFDKATGLGLREFFSLEIRTGWGMGLLSRRVSQNRAEANSGSACGLAIQPGGSRNKLPEPDALGKVIGQGNPQGSVVSKPRKENRRRSLTPLAQRCGNSAISPHLR